MAGMRPFFLTGANAKIRVNNTTLAFCTNLSYSVQVNHATPRVLGMYEPTSVEPLSYLVTGSFSIIKYVADVKDEVGGRAPQGTDSRGNGIGNWGPDGLAKKLMAGFNTGAPDGRAYDALNPSKLDKATGFEIHVYQKVPNGDVVSVAKIREARITRQDFNLGMKSAATETYQFTAVYADEDSFIADFSGRGQHLV